MSDQLLHQTDRFGNDIWLGDAGDVKMAALTGIDYSTYLRRIRDVELRPDDVIVVGFPKSGNNWMHHMVSMLMVGTTHLSPMLGEDNFQFLDGMSDDVRLPPLNQGPRALFSHLPFRFLPRDVTTKKVKVVYLTRNPKDVFVSLYCHMSKLKAPLGYQGTWPQFFTVMLQDGGLWYGDVFDYLRDWQTEMASHPDHPILHCSYEDTKQNTLAQVERLNGFLETGRDRQLCQEIVGVCHLGNMHVTRRQPEVNFQKRWMFKEGVSPTKFYRKGIIGDWKNWFTVTQNQLFDDVFAEKMADYKQTVVFE